MELELTKSAIFELLERKYDEFNQCRNKWKAPACFIQHPDPGSCDGGRVPERAPAGERAGLYHSGSAGRGPDFYQAPGCPFNSGAWVVLLRIPGR